MGIKPKRKKLVATAKNILDKGTNPERAQFLPYLLGNVAFYGGITGRPLNNC